MSTSARQGPIEGKRKGGEEKVESRIGDNHAMTIGSQTDANVDITVQNTIPGDNQADARFVVQLDTIHHSVLNP